MENIIEDNIHSLNKKWCDALRARIPNPPCPAHPDGDMQFFAYFKNPAGEAVEDGVVIAIGSNYSQGDNKMQGEDAKGRTSCLSNYYPSVLGQIRENEKKWRNMGWLRGKLPARPPRHFIMTNLVPWITSKKDKKGRELSWGDLPRDECEKLRALYFDNFEDGHLAELEKAHPHAFVVWHGINENIYPHIEAAIKRSKWKNWAFYANLTRPFQVVWEEGGQRPKFKMGKR